MEGDDNEKNDNDNDKDKEEGYKNGEDDGYHSYDKKMGPAERIQQLFGLPSDEQLLEGNVQEKLLLIVLGDRKERVN